MLKPLLLRILVTALVASALVLTAWRPAGAHHGDIHARCVRDQPMVTERPPGMENILVVCVRGLPEFTVLPEVIPTFNPIGAALQLPNPPDFGGWVTVCTNASQSPFIWYNVGIEPGKGCCA